MATDIHLIQAPGPTAPAPVPHPFSGILDGGLSGDVNINGRPAATLNSTATNTPVHIPQGGTFVNPPTNRATIIRGSATVFINKRPACRHGDTALTCNDPVPLPVGSVIATSTVLIGG
ncbi:PAAR domain-containing protein [Rhodococcus sp. IEGM 1307]|uniref:PAAR domain-containing protein n=1 Tax=Rhodococcus sp. IEGM 1307 TaxID=3047091 RepID=UPI0024B69BCA|nr:PAAR domain-containing protein [Rhodococcus sp. IEGM 1307]MDI9978793.1 PAAR domain-containing protein [Rhodococcus sp. IEGM 1307]